MRALKVLNTVRNLRRGATTDPRFLTYIVTFTCNARCIMCDSWKKPSKDALKLDEIEGIFDQLPQMDAVRLTGGEPFVRPDLTQIHDIAVEKVRPVVMHITTNGFLTDKVVQLCEQRNRKVPLQLLISVDGVEEKHNQVRGDKKAWAQVMGTLEALSPRQRELNIRVGINQTIVDAEGVEHYKLLSKMLKPYKVRHGAVLAYDMSATYSLDSDVVAEDQIGQFTTFGEFTQDDLAGWLRAVEEDSRDLPLPERIGKRYYTDGIRNRLLDHAFSPNPHCVQLNAHMRLMPNGDVPVCQFNTRRVGNLREQTFREVWHGQSAEKERDWVKNCPGCWAECEVLPSAAYTGDLIGHTLKRGTWRKDRKVSFDKRAPAKGAVREADGRKKLRVQAS